MTTAYDIHHVDVVTHLKNKYQHNRRNPASQSYRAFKGSQLQITFEANCAPGGLLILFKKKLPDDTGHASIDP